MNPGKFRPEREGDGSVRENGGMNGIWSMLSAERIAVTNKVESKLMASESNKKEIGRKEEKRAINVEVDGWESKTLGGSDSLSLVTAKLEG